MGNNGIQKYFKYAIGEIFLIVIGILFALEINTLNQNWVASKEEQKTLHNLKSDFVYNLNTIEKLIIQTEDKIQSNITLLNLTGPNTPNPQNLNIDSLLGQAAGVPIYVPREGFLDELINTAQLQIITNDQLRNKLSLWKPSLSFLNNREESTLIAMRMTADFMSRHGSWLNVDQFDSQMKTRIPAPTFDTDNKDLLKSQEFQNNVVSGFWALNTLISKQKTIVTITKEIITLINQEIDSENE